MHVVVLGAGLAGITTAWYLTQSGAQVTVVERAGAVASAASYANAAQLSYSYTDSLATPDFIRRLPQFLWGREARTHIRLTPDLLAWGTRFLLQCTRARSQANTLFLLDMAMRSATLMTSLRQQLAIDFEHRSAGKFVLLSSDRDVRLAEQTTLLKQRSGSDVELLSRAAAIAIEPSLEHITEPFSAAVYSAGDEVADAHAFAVGLQQHLEQSGRVDFRLDTTAKGLLREHGRVTGVDCGTPIRADAVVVCMGAWSPAILAAVGLNPRIYPVRGYSLTLPAGDATPSASVTSLRHRIAISRLGQQTRVAGFADFNGFRTDTDSARIDDLARTAAMLAPEAADYGHADRSPWGGFRPMTPDGRPLVGATAVAGLYLNTGHGMLGWTLACASGEEAAAAVLREQQ